MSVIPPTRVIHQVAGDTEPIGWTFREDVTGIVFELAHSLFGTFTLTGAGTRVELPITEERAATAVGTSATYTLVANPGVVGYEQTAARGPWLVIAREYAP
jgi:hypothetical protein